MSELDTFVQLIKNILGNENQLRKESETILNQVRERNPNQYFLGLLELLKGSNDPQIRNFCAVMMRKQLSIFSEANFNAMWPLLDGPTATKIKEEIFVILTKESASNIRHQICWLIGELGATVNSLNDEDKKKMPQEGQEWAKFVPQIMECWMSEIPSMMEATLRIMSSLFNYSSEQFLNHKKDLFAVFKKGLEHEEINIKTAAVDTLTSWVSVIPPKDTRLYEELLPQMMEAILYVLAKDEYQGQESLGNIIDLIEHEPSFFKKNFGHLFQTMQKICGVKNVEDDNIKQMAIQSICLFAEREPVLFEKDPKLLRSYLEMVLAYMIEVSADPDSDWETPKEGYMESREGTEYSGERYGCEIINRLAECVGQQQLLKTLAELVQQMLASSDWRFKYTALMSLSQLGEHINDLNDIVPVAETAVRHFKDPHPKTRWAAYHVIGMLAEDCHPEFQIRFHETLIPTLIQSLNEPVPRVLCHVLNCLSNFMESLPEEHTPPYIEMVLTSIFPILKDGKVRLMRECSLAVLSATAEAAKTNFKPYADKCVPFLFEILKTHTQKEQKQMRGQAIETLTIIGSSIEKEAFAKYLPDVVQILLSIMNDVSLDDADPQRSYLIAGWQRICITLGEDFIPYLDVILPPTLKLVEIVLNNAPKEEEEISEYAVSDDNFGKRNRKDKANETVRQNLNTFDHEEVEIAISMIQVFVTELKKGYIPYVEKTTEIILRAVSYKVNNNIREKAAGCLPALLEVVKDSTHEMKDQVVLKLAHMFLNSLWKEVEKEYDPETLIMQISSFKNCIDVCGRFMNKQELEELSSKILLLLSESDKRKTEKNKYKNLEDEDDELAGYEVDPDDDDEEDLHIALAELMGILFKTHKELTLPLAGVVYTQILSKVLQPGLSDKMHKFGLFLIDDMVDYLGYELIPDIWPHLAEALIKFATDKTAYIRQASVFGIGLLAQRGKEYFKGIAEVCVQKVAESLKIPKGNEVEKIYNFSVDNSVATLGKIMQLHPEKVNVPVLAKLWFSHLPLKADIPEGLGQHELLMDILLSGNASMILGDNGEGIGHLLKIIAQITDSKMSNDSIKQKMTKVLKGLVEGPTQKLVEQGVMGLSELQKQRIRGLLKV